MNNYDQKKIKSMRIGGKILSNIIKELVSYIKPGINVLDIENKSEILIKKYKVLAAFKNFHGYPANTCISINEQIVHAIPRNRIVKSGDILSLDFGIRYDNYCTDSAITIPVGKVSKQAQKLIKTTKQALYAGIKAIKPGIKMGTIQSKIQNIITQNNLGLITELTGHGIGRQLQEYPQIPNYGEPNTGLTLYPGMTFCLEPMTTLGNGQIKIAQDGWTIQSKDNTLSAHFEHTIAVTQNGYQILTE
jgi:methionyl aminopeptidase